MWGGADAPKPPFPNVPRRMIRSLKHESAITTEEKYRETNKRGVFKIAWKAVLQVGG